MRLSSLADYAVLLMRSAATHCGGSRVNAASLAAETGLPVPTAQKLVSQLGRAGLLKSMRGSGGGIKLSRPAAAITLADIVEAVEGPIALTACLDPAGLICAPGAPCVIQPHWRGLNAVVRDALRNVTLASLIAVPERANRAVERSPFVAEDAQPEEALS
jgi:FeS assembly SUF system regulator